MEPHRRARRAADQVGAVAGRLLRRVRRRDLAARRRPRRAARRRRHGLRRQPLRHRDRAAHLPGGPGTSTPAFEPRPHAALRAPVAGAVPGLPTADGWIVVGCAKEKFWQRLCAAHRPARPGRRPALRGLRRPRRARAPSCSTDARQDVLGRGPSAEWLEPPRGGRRAVRARSTTSRRRWPIRRRRPASWCVETEHPRFGTVRQVAVPSASASSRRRHRRAPLRHEDGDGILRRCSATTGTGSRLWRPAAPSDPSPPAA